MEERSEGSHFFFSLTGEMMIGRLEAKDQWTDGFPWVFSRRGTPSSPANGMLEMEQPVFPWQ